MGCTNATALTGITFDCNDSVTGGLRSIYLCHKADIVTGTVVDGSMTVLSATTGKIVQIEFNNKDAYTNFTDPATMDATGIGVVAPVITVEIPKMTSAHRNELNTLITSAGMELVAFVETAAGSKHCVGLDYGLYASSVNGQSGSGRAEKNMFQLTLTGEEDNLAYDALAVADVWTEVEAGGTA